jgi:hypothetical protein
MNCDFLNFEETRRWVVSTYIVGSVMSARRTRFTNLREPFARVCAITSRHASSTKNGFFEVHRVSLICHKSSPKSALDVIMNALICHPLIASPRGPFHFPWDHVSRNSKTTMTRPLYPIPLNYSHPSPPERVFYTRCHFYALGFHHDVLYVARFSRRRIRSNPMCLFMDCLPRGMFLVMSYLGQSGAFRRKLKP